MKEAYNVSLPVMATLAVFTPRSRLLPAVPVIRGSVKFQPAYVTDVARAIASAAIDPGSYGGKTFELGGPDILSMADLNRQIAEGMGRDPAFVLVPDAVARSMASSSGTRPSACAWRAWSQVSICDSPA